MANTKYDTRWSLEEALSLIRRISPGLKVAGFYVGLTGSVLTVGASQHDLDLIVYPAQSTVTTDFSLARYILISEGWEVYIPAERVQYHWRKKGNNDTKEVEVWLTGDNRRVDVFFLR